MSALEDYIFRGKGENEALEKLLCFITPTFRDPRQQHRDADSNAEETNGNAATSMVTDDDEPEKETSAFMQAAQEVIFECEEVVRTLADYPFDNISDSPVPHNREAVAEDGSKKREIDGPLFAQAERILVRLNDMLDKCSRIQRFEEGGAKEQWA